jgi:hypothetical protein
MAKMVRNYHLAIDAAIFGLFHNDAAKERPREAPQAGLLNA